MEQKRRGRPPKVNPAVVESVNEPVKQLSRDAVIEITLTMPGYPEHKDKVVIKDIMGKVLGSQRRPEVYMQSIKDKLK